MGSGKQSGNNQNQNGFSAVEVVLVVLVVGLLGAVGYLFYARPHTNKMASTTTSTSTAKPANDNASQNASDSSTDWKTYTLANEKLSFKYPGSWKLADHSGTDGVPAGTDDVELSGTDAIGGDTFHMSILAGEMEFTLPSGGLHVVAANPVMFTGKYGYLVAYDGNANSGQVIDTELSSVQNQIDFFHTANADASKGGEVHIGMEFGDVMPHDWQQVQASKDYQNAKAVIESMKY